jgi:hypothetical protein
MKLKDNSKIILSNMPFMIILMNLVFVCINIQINAKEPDNFSVVYVNNNTGSALFDGSAEKPIGDGKTGPCATIMQGLKSVSIGGKVIIANTGKDYRERVRIGKLRKGRAATPLVIEGCGAAVSGLVTVKSTWWKLYRDDIYYYEFNKTDDPTIESESGLPNSNWLGALKHQGWFSERQAPEIFFVNGKSVLHVNDLVKIPECGFFYDTQANPRRIYFRLPENSKIDDCIIDIPLNCGVFVDDDYVVVRNLISRYSQDDGFAGFWGIGVVFENCNGSYNCDQGISLHGTSMTLIDGGLFERNGGCGIADVMSSFTLYRNVVVRDNMIMGALFQGLAHSMLSCRLFGNYGSQIASGQGSIINLTNCLIIGNQPAEGSGTGVQIERGRLDHCTIINCTTGLSVSKSATITNSVFANCISDLISIQPTSISDFKLHSCWFKGNRVSLGSSIVDAKSWEEFAKTNKSIDKIIWDDIKLEAPIYKIPDDSPYIKSADYNTRPGAVLPLWEKWEILPSSVAPEIHPHP